jgi:hypothetical protein
MVSGIMPGRYQVVQGRLDVQVQPAIAHHSSAACTNAA